MTILPTNPANLPLVAITTDFTIRNTIPTARCSTHYAKMVIQAGGLPVFLTPDQPLNFHPSRFDAYIFTGGDDPVTEPFGCPTSPHAIKVLPERQSFETTLLNELHANHPQIPVLGICLGMQMMGLTTKGQLNQHLPDTHQTHQDHWESTHTIHSTAQHILPNGTVYSKHRQALQTPGQYTTIATAHDNTIEAIKDPNAKFRLGVQWHPERTNFKPLGLELFKQLIAAI